MRDKKPSKSNNHSLKQLKRQAKKQTYSLPAPPVMAGIPRHTHRSDTVTTLYSSTSNDCTPNKEDLSRIIENQNTNILHLQRVVESVKEENESLLTRASVHSIAEFKGTTTTQRKDIGEEGHVEMVMDTTQLLRKQVAEQSGRLQIVEAELNKAHRMIQIKDGHIVQCERELKNTSNMVAEKQEAINTLSDILNSEQEENEQLRNQPLELTNALYNDLVGRVALAVEIEPTIDTTATTTTTTTHTVADDDFAFEEVDGPVSLAGSYVIINRVKSSFAPVQVGDIVLEVNGCSCRGVDSSAAIQILEERDKPLKLVIARSQSQSNYDRQHSNGNSVNSGSDEIPPPLPSCHAPLTDLPSSTSLDNVLPVSVFNKPQHMQDDINNTELAQKVFELEDKCKKLTATLAHKEKREIALLKELQSEKADKNDYMLQVSRFESKLRTEKDEKERLLSECRDIQTANNRLTKELDQNKERLELEMKTNDEKYAELAIQLSSLKSQYEALQLKHRGSTIKRVDDSQEKVTNMQAEIDKMRKMSKEKENRLVAEVNRRELERIKVTQDIEKLNIENESVKKELNVSLQEISRLTNDVEKAKKKIESAKESAEQLKRERDLLFEDVKKAKERKEEIEKEMSTVIQKKINDAQVEYQKVLREKERDLENAQKEATSLGLKVQALETLQHDRMALLESDLQNSRKHSERREDTIAEKDDRITQLHFSLKELSTEQQKEIREKMKQLENAQKELLAHKEKVQSLEMDKRIQQERLSLLDNEVQTLRKDSERKEETITNKDSQITEVHSTLTEMNSELRLLQKQVLDEKENGNSLIEKLKGTGKELRKVESLNEKLKQQLQKYESDLETKSNESDILKKEKENLEKKLEEINATLNRERNASKLEEQRLNRDIEKFKAEVEISRKQIEASEREVHLYKEKAETLITTMERDLQSTKQQSEKKEESVTEKDRQIIKLYAMVDQLNSEIKSQQGQLKDEKDQSGIVSETLKSANSKVTSLQASNEELSSLMQMHKTEIVEMTSKIDRLQQETVALKLDNDKSKLVNKEIKTANAKLQSDFDTKLREFETYKQTVELQVSTYKGGNEALIKEGDKLSEQITNQERKSSALTTELAELKRKTDSERADLEKEKQEMALKLASLEQQLLTVNNELTSQKTSYVSLESKTNSLYEQLGYIKSEKEKVEEKHTNAVREHEKLKADVEAVKKSSVEKAMSSQQLIGEKEKEIEAKQTILKSLEEKIVKIEKENSLLQQKMDRMSQEAEEEMNEMTTKFTKEIGEAKTSQTKEVTELQRIKMEMSEQLISSQKEVSILSERSSKLQKSLEELTEQYDKAKQSSDEELGEEKNLRKTLENKIGEIEERNKRLQENTESEITREMNELKNVREELKRQLDKSQTEQTQLIEEIDRSKKELDKSNAEIKSLNEYVQRLLPVVMEFKPSVLAVEKKYSSITY